jgi:hypothetical protein
MTDTIRYMTVIEPVLEVTLIGNVQAVLWQPILEAEGFHPPQANSIPIIISGTQAKYMGVTFRELSISLGIDDKRFLLIHAFNSNRFFAWTERKMFRTPYYHAQITVEPNLIVVSQLENPLIEVAIQPDATITHQADEDYRWTICLPKALRKNMDMPHYFHARLAGHTQHYAPQLAHLNFSDSSNDILSRLAKSHFELTDWSVRMTAQHSKSKTFLGDSTGG